MRCCCGEIKERHALVYTRKHSKHIQHVHGGAVLFFSWLIRRATAAGVITVATGTLWASLTPRYAHNLVALPQMAAPRSYAREVETSLTGSHRYVMVDKSSKLGNQYWSRLVPGRVNLYTDACFFSSFLSISLSLATLISVVVA